MLRDPGMEPILPEFMPTPPAGSSVWHRACATPQRSPSPAPRAPWGQADGEGDTLLEAKRAAEKAAKDKLGAKSTHHPTCRCRDPKGDTIIPTR